jgi:hypothetical protein
MVRTSGVSIRSKSGIHLAQLGEIEDLQSAETLFSC